MKPLRIPSLCFAVVCGVLASAFAFAKDDEAAKSVRNGELSAEELADFLGVGVWVFEYDGGRPRCRLEIEEEGQQTVSKKEVLVVEEPADAPDAGKGPGKILFFLRPADIQVRINSATTRGGSGLALPADALWWGWSGFSGSTTRLEKPIDPKPGEDVVLLRYETQEAKEGAEDPEHLRKVVLTLVLTIDGD